MEENSEDSGPLGTDPLLENSAFSELVDDQMTQALETSANLSDDMESKTDTDLPTNQGASTSRAFKLFSTAYDMVFRDGAKTLEMHPTEVSPYTAAMSKRVLAKFRSENVTIFGPVKESGSGGESTESIQMSNSSDNPEQNESAEGDPSNAEDERPSQQQADPMSGEEIWKRIKRYVADWDQETANKVSTVP
jgi:hypothetical protein